MTRPRILLVDRSAGDRGRLARDLERHMPDCELEVSTDASEAWSLACLTPPDCAVLAAGASGEDILGLCRRLKTHEATSHFPILLLLAREAGPQSYAEAGAEDCLYYPVDDEELARRLRVLLRIKQMAELAEGRSRYLHEYEERYRLLFNTVGEAIVAAELNEDGATWRVVEANDRACELTGCSGEELLESPLKAYVAPEWLGGLAGRIESILKHKHVFFETMLQTKQGREIPVAVHARLFELGDRNTIIFVCRSEDTAARTPDAAQEVDARYRLMAAQTGQMIYDFALRDGKSKWGGAVTQVTGFTAGEMGALDLSAWKNRIHPEDVRHYASALDEATKAVGKYQIEYRARHRSGEYRYLEDLGVILPDETGKAYRILGTLKDITARVRAEEDRRRLEREAQHTQRLESLGVLAGGIAHDFNNMLTAIIGLADLALSDIPKDWGCHRDIEEALQAAHRAKELVKQILTFSRQSGEERAPLYMHLVVREALNFLRASLPATIKISDNVDVESGAVLANAAQMHQVVMNYCTNAAQSMAGKPGMLEVRLIDVVVDEQFAATHPKLHPGPYVKLSVRDTGHGIDPHVLHRVFDPFFTTKGPGEGTGMGLSVVHGIVTSHGGAVIVESTPGRGATFHTYFPRVEGKAPKENVGEKQAPGKGKRILFVDDEPGEMRSRESLLPALGYDMVFCDNGPDALEVFREAPDTFDLVITDQSMPNMAGDELASRLHTLRPDLPIILFAGFSEQISDEMVRESGITHVLRKPVIARDLDKCIREILDGPNG